VLWVKFQAIRREGVAVRAHQSGSGVFKNFWEWFPESLGKVVERWEAPDNPKSLSGARVGKAGVIQSTNTTSRQIQLD
jgi:hypothetical protein